MCSSINEQLQALYETHYEKLLHEYRSSFAHQIKDQLTNPLLISIDEDKYQKSDLKIMFFGQETNDWEGPCGKEINELLCTYQKFLTDGNRRGQFWNAVSDYTQAIQEKNPNKCISYVWNNILKIGKAHEKGKPSSEGIELQQKYFPVIKDEVEILKPDIIIFFTGPYDDYIRYEFPDINLLELNGWNDRELCQLNSAYLPARSFRTSHPTKLCYQGKAYMSAVKDSIIALI